MNGPKKFSGPWMIAACFFTLIPMSRFGGWPKPFFMKTSNRASPKIRSRAASCPIRPHRSAAGNSQGWGAKVDGEVVKVYVENGHAVQYGERLFAVLAAVLVWSLRHV